MKAILSTLLLVVGAVLCAQTADAQIIVIDPGHGGDDPGGTGSGLLEKAIVLDTSERFRDLLDADTADTDGGGSWAPHLTRETDVFVALAARASYANSVDADRFLSVHANAFGTTSANGTETFSYNNGTTSADLRDFIQEEMVNSWQLTDRGSKTGNYSVLRNTAMPAELHELGFLTNSTDAAKLGSSDARQNAALAHLHGLQRHYGLATYTPGDNSDEQELLGTLDVTVIDELGPVAGATVFLDGEEQGLTGSEGSLRIEDLQAADYLLSATSPHHLPGDTSAQLEAGATLSAQVSLVSNGNIDDPEVKNPGEKENEPALLLGGCSQSGGQTPGPLLGLLLVLLAATRRRARAALAAGFTE